MNNKKKTVGKWYQTLWCQKCDNILTSDEQMYSNGICPYCGADSKSTIVNTNTKVFRKITTSWFNFDFPFWHSESVFEEKR